MWPWSWTRIRSVTSLSAVDLPGFWMRGKRGVEVSPTDRAAIDPASDSSGRESRPGDEPDEADGQSEHAEADEELPLDQTPGAGHQLVARGGQEQDQRLPGARLDGAAGRRSRPGPRSGAGCPATPEWPR